MTQANTGKDGPEIVPLDSHREHQINQAVGDNSLRFATTSRAFLAALRKPETYLPYRNPYVFFGLLWGIPIPLVTFATHLRALDASPSWAAIFYCIQMNWWHVWFVLHPVLFAVVFGAMGTLTAERRREVDRLLDHLNHLARTDGLTGLFNHRAFQKRIRTEAARAEREEQPLALLMIDLDFFKRFNDEFGHPAGDELLKAVAQRLVDHVRPYDVVCRYGGEEFAVLMPGMDEADGSEAAERIRSTLADEGVEELGIRPGRVTLSVGVAEYDPEEWIPDWIERADRNLYQAKHSGRNCVYATSGIVGPPDRVGA